MSGVPSICDACRNSHHDGTCEAFRDGIPDAILVAQQIDHRQPYAGDHGIRFEPREDLPAEAIADLLDMRAERWAAFAARQKG